MFKRPLVAQHNAGAGVGRAELGQRRAAGKAGEFGLDCLDERVVIEIARGGEYDGAAVEAGAMLGEELLLVETGDGFRSAEDGLAERMVWKSRELMPPPSTVFKISVA